MVMMVNGGAHEFRAFAGVPVNTGLMQQIQEHNAFNNSRLMQSASEAYSSLRSTLGSFNWDNARRKLQAITRSLENVFLLDTIQELKDIGQLQHAPSKMIPYIMAQPDVRHMYHNQRCYGYGERYIDPYPERIKEEDPVYRSVMDGVWDFDDEEGICYTNYWLDEEVEVLPDLSATEKFDILNTWDRLVNILNIHESDPTSPHNAQL